MMDQAVTKVKDFLVSHCENAYTILELEDSLGVPNDAVQNAVTELYYDGYVDRRGEPIVYYHILKEVTQQSVDERARALEDDYYTFLGSKGYQVEKQKTLTGVAGPWKIDLFIDLRRPVLIECKNPSSRSTDPNIVVRHVAAEAFTEAYDLMNHSEAKDGVFIVCLGYIPLKTPTKDFHKLLESIGAHVVAHKDRNELLRIIEKLAPYPRKTRRV